MRLIEEELRFESAILSLHDEVFGPGRFARAAERLREENILCRNCSRLVLSGEELVATARVWPLSISGGVEGVCPALLGPVAVAPGYHRRGIGAKLINAAVRAALADRFTAIIAIGGLDYFSRLGFVLADEDLLLPSPVVRDRLLVFQPDSGAESLRGYLSVPRATMPAP